MNIVRKWWYNGGAMIDSRPSLAKPALRGDTRGESRRSLRPMRQHTHTAQPTNGRSALDTLHGMDLLQHLPKQDLDFILSHRRQVAALVKEKAKPKVAKTQSAPIGIMRLRAIVTAMGFKTPADMANALLSLDKTRTPNAPRATRAKARHTHRWSRRKLFPERRAAIVADIKGGSLTIDRLASKHHVSQATISRIKRDEGLVGYVATQAAQPTPEPVAAHA